MSTSDHGAQVNSPEPANKAIPNCNEGGSTRIYADFYQLRESPFSITPDPEFLFLSETHQSVIEKIHYAIQGRMGFMLLTGEVGTGKTTLCRALLDQLEGKARTVYIINPSLSGEEILVGILEDLGVTCQPGTSKKELIDQLNTFLLGREMDIPVVIIVDDAQTMPLPTLEDLRLLSNLETDKSKLIQMLVVGQPELLDNLGKPEMRQLKQRVMLSCYLERLTRDEVPGYIERRLFVAGNQGQVRFTPKAIKRIHAVSDGVPRLINKICDMALTAAYIANSSVIDSRCVRSACSEIVELHRPKKPMPAMASRFQFSFSRWMAVALGVGLAAVVGYSAAAHLKPSTKVAAPVVAPEPPPNQQTPASQVTAETPPGTVGMTASNPATGIYILQLGSYNTLETTLRAVDIYAQKGIDAFWNAVEIAGKGTLYRVFTGRYTTVAEAKSFQQEHLLSHARIMRAPWTILLGPENRAAQFEPFLVANQFDSYTAATPDGQVQLYSGAYLSLARAETMVTKISRLTGMGVSVVDLNRQALPINPKERLAHNGNPT